VTDEERRIVARLKRLARDWPKSLWLFSGDGTLHVMRAGPDGERVETASGGVDPEYSVATIDIPADGGGW
jgi:hypothetical protein